MNVDIYTYIYIYIYRHASVTLIHKKFIFWDTCLLILKGVPAYKRRLTAWQVCYNLCLPHFQEQN